MCATGFPEHEVERRAGRALAAILLAGVALKLGFLVSYAASNPHFRRPAADSVLYLSWAREIQRDPLGSDVFYQAPLYPYLIAPLVPAEGQGFLAVYLLQLGLGIGLLYLVYRAGRAAFGPRAGLIAATLGLLHAPLTACETKLLPTTVGLTLGAGALVLLLEAERGRGGRWRLAAGGLLLGLAIVCRPQLILVPALASVLLLVRRARAGARRTSLVVAVLLLPAAAVGLVTLRNLVVGGEAVLIGANGGVTFAQGNCAGAEGSLGPLAGLSGRADSQEAESRAVAEQALGRPLSAVEVDRYWLGRGLSWIREDPAGWLSLLGKKALLALSSRELGSCYLLAIDLEISPWLRVACLPFGLIVAWAAAGALRLVRERRPGSILLALLLGPFLMLLAFYVTSRYRLALLPPALVLAGGGLDGLVRALRAGQRGEVLRLAVPAGVVLALGLPPLFPMSSRALGAGDAAFWHNLAAAWDEEGRPEEALAALERATALAPARWDLQLERIRRLEARGDRARLAATARALGEAPFATAPEARIVSGRAFEGAGRPLEALTAYRAALELEPGHPGAAVAAGALLGRLGRPGAARAVLGEALARAPGDADLALNYALACWDAGQQAEARAWAARYRAVRPDDPRMGRNPGLFGPASSDAAATPPPPHRIGWGP